MITLSAEWLQAHWDNLKSAGLISLPLSNWDGSDAFTLTEMGPLPSGNVVVGQLVLHGEPTSDALVVVRLARQEDASTKSRTDRFAAEDGGLYSASGQYTGREPPVSLPVEIIQVSTALAERRTALLESTVLKDASVFVAGLGTGGIAVALELAKTGVGRFRLMDGDRLSVGNIARHQAGISHAGRRKVYVARDLIHEKNPAATVEVDPRPADQGTEAEVRAFIRASDVVVCAVDGRPSKLYLNRLCFEEKRAAIYGGAFRRAYGGQVLRVRPGTSPCYQCFVMAMPERDVDFEVASAQDAEEIAYSDRLAQIEPGLSLDVAPIALMLARLALQELLLGRPTTLKVLERDFSAPWYLWVNRPEPGTPYASWPPLSESADEMTIQRWYGIDFARDPGCPVCGNFVSTARDAYDLGTTQLSEVPQKSLDSLNLPLGE